MAHTAPKLIGWRLTVTMSGSMNFITPSRREGAALWLFTACALCVSFWMSADHLTWFLEVFWIVFALPALALTWRRLPLTRLLCWLLVLHALVLIHGGTHTYVEAPLGHWLREFLGFERNPWDRIGHLMQGFVPAILAREMLLRFSPLERGGLLIYLVLAICLSFAALFELMEWWAALLFGADADAFLALQGDVWDTQWDMFLCLVGAMLSLALLSRAHDRQLGI